MFYLFQKKRLLTLYKIGSAFEIYYCSRNLLLENSVVLVDTTFYCTLFTGRRIVVLLQGYWEGYDATVNPNIIAAFSAAAFRFGHSLLPTAVERWSKAHKFIGQFFTLQTKITSNHHTVCLSATNSSSLLYIF